MTNKHESRELGAICDENGVVIADEERVMNRWKEYFEGLLGVDEIDRMWGQGGGGMNWHG